MNLPITRKKIFAFGVLLCALLAGMHSHATEENTDSESAADPAGELPLEELRTFTKVFGQIRHTYVEEVDDVTLLKNAIKGMLTELDPHSAYLDEESFDDLQINTSGEFGGLGIEVGMEDGFVKVISPIDDTPAQRAGIEAGDLIIKIDETPVKGIGLGEAVDMMRGEKGTEILLTIIRKGTEQPLEFTIVRDIIRVQSVRANTIEPGFAYIRIAQFQINTGEDLDKALDKLFKENNDELHGVILDLRNNPGGVLQASVDVTDSFLDGGLVVYTKGRAIDSELHFEATAGDRLNNAPIVVLINDGSASASEIVAGALQDHRRAIVMGTRSFGKGSVQSVIPITDERAIKLTTARYYTPGGRSIQAQGIEPDIIVERATLEAVHSGSETVKEANLAGHLSNEDDEEDDSEKTAAQKSLEILERDNQLYEAITVLKAIHLNGLRPSPTLAKTVDSGETDTEEKEAVEKPVDDADSFPDDD